VFEVAHQIRRRGGKTWGVGAGECRAVEECLWTEGACQVRKESGEGGEREKEK
jgi:hypothetical protein